MNCLSLATQSLVKEKEKYDLILENTKAEKNEMAEELKKIEKEAFELKQRADFFENEGKIICLNDEEIQSLEQSILSRISDFKEEKAKRKYQKIFNEIQEKLEKNSEISNFCL